MLKIHRWSVTNRHYTWKNMCYNIMSYWRNNNLSVIAAVCETAQYIFFRYNSILSFLLLFIVIFWISNKWKQFCYSQTASNTFCFSLKFAREYATAFRKRATWNYRDVTLFDLDLRRRLTLITAWRTTSSLDDLLQRVNESFGAVSCKAEPRLSRNLLSIGIVFKSPRYCIEGPFKPANYLSAVLNERNERRFN